MSELTRTRFYHKCGHLSSTRRVKRQNIPRACDKAMACDCPSCVAKKKRGLKKV